MTRETPKTEELAHGVRVVARLTRSDETSASYELEVAVPGCAFGGRADFAGDGELTLTWGAEAPVSAVESILRALLRSGWHRRRAGEPWPRRLSRWRPDPATEQDPE
jgi:hypothetical protein